MPTSLPRGLYALYDDTLGDPVPKILAAVRGGARVVQLRLKHTPDREALALARALKPQVPELILNDRVDLALLAGIGVHLGADDLPVAEARALLGPSARIGATCRNVAEARAAQAQGADHIGVGPVFCSRTKQLPVPLLGVEGLREVVAGSPLPVVAISGIDSNNIAQVARAGAHAAAVSHALFARTAEDIERIAALMVSLFDR